MKRKLTHSDFALWAALPMAHTSKVEGRIKMILDSTRRRTSPRRFLLLAAMMGAAVLVPLSMLRPAAQAQATPSASSAQQQKARRQALARVSAVHAVPGELDAYQLTRQGQTLTLQAAAALEYKLAGQPDDYAAHLSLLGYYQKFRFAPLPAGRSYQQQVFWLIRNHPESVLLGTPDTMLLKCDDPAAFEEGEALWLNQIAKHPTNTTLIGKAADYCLLSDKATTEKLLLQAQALEPKSSVWPSKLGQLYRLNGPHPSAEVIQQSAKKALAEYEAASMLANKTAQPNTSPDLAKTAFDAGEYDKARQYADALLVRSQSKQPTGFDLSDDVHAANLVLGRLALHDGDTAGAEAHLLAMGRVSGSPVLSSFGPNMQLAQDLLEHGDRAPVLAYFNECAKFWTFGQAKATLATWTAQVKQGQVPDFRGNLVY